MIYDRNIDNNAQIQPHKILGAGVLLGKDNNAYYVDGNNGSDNNSGRIPRKAFKTIQHGINAASAGDVIYIYSLGYDTDASDPTQYEEDLSIAYAKHDLKLIGVSPQSGTKMPYAGPKIKNATATTLLKVSAPGVLLENLQFNCTRNSGTYGLWFDGIAGYATVAGSVGFTVRNCFIKNGDSNYGIRITGGYGGMITHSTLQYCTYGINFDSSVLPNNGHTIEYCNFKSINNGTITVHITIPAGSSHDWNIDHCNFQKATKFITCGASGVSGNITNCMFNDSSTAVLAKSSGKVEIPAGNDEVGVAGCYGGDGTLVDADGG